MNELQTLRLQGLKVIAGIGVGCGLLAAGWALYLGQWPMALLAVLLAAVPVWLALGGAVDSFSRCLAGATMPAFAALLTALARDSSWIIDMHMTFFAFMAMLALLVDWRPIVTATAVTAVHHLSLNFIAPLYVFPDGPDLMRVLFHAVVVVVEAGALVIVSLRLESFVLGQAQERREREQQEDAIKAERERVSSNQRDVLHRISSRLNALAAGQLDQRIEQPFLANTKPSARRSTTLPANCRAWSARSPRLPRAFSRGHPKSAATPKTFRNAPRSIPHRSNRSRAPRASSKAKCANRQCFAMKRGWLPSG